MDSPPLMASPSPSTPSSGDEDYQVETAVSTSPVPKRRAVASSTASGIPGAFNRAGLRTRGGGGGGGGGGDSQSQQFQGSGSGGGKRSATLEGIVGGGGGGGGQKEELVDVAVMNEIRQLIGDPFDESIIRDRA